MSSQQDSAVSAKNRWAFQVEPVIGLQLWSTYTIGQQVYDREKGTFIPADNRLNFQIRRARLGVKGQFRPGLKYNIIASLDLVGRDLLSGTDAGANNGASPQFRLWNLYVDWQPFQANDMVHLVAGYFPPQIGRENMHSALRVPSMEKAWSQNYLRMHLTGTGPGRLPGLNLGGLLRQNNGTVHLGYDIGLFSTTYQAWSGNSAGLHASPLVTGRVGLYMGPAMSGAYSLGQRVDASVHEHGMAIGIAGAYQGDTDAFHANTALGVDLLVYLGRFHFDGDWTWTSRSISADPEENSMTDIAGATGYARLGYSIPMSEERFLEFVAMYSAFKGADDLDTQSLAVSAGIPTASEHSVDLGVNYYIDRHFKLSLHYTFRGADAGEAGEIAGVNNYYFQKGIGNIKRGNWVGLGVVFLL